MLSLSSLAGSPLTVPPSNKECGKSIYLEGVDCGGTQIKSRLGDVALSGKAQACANCHGSSGKGAREGGVVAGDITWEHLTLPYGHSDADGRKHPPFTKKSFYRAVTQGLDPANHRLPVTMPRFQLSRQQAGDVADYLKSISTDFDPGLTTDVIRIAVLLPAEAVGEATASALKQTLIAYFADVNRAGAIYGRQVDLHFVDSMNNRQGLAQVRKLVDQGGTFALLNPWGVPEKQVSELAEASRIPLMTLSEGFPGDSHYRYVFSLLPGPLVEAAQLIQFAVHGKGISSGRAAVIFSSNAESNQLQGSVEQAWRDVAVAPATVFSVTASSELFPSIVQQLYKETESVFFFGPAHDAMAFMQAAREAQWAPTLFLAGSVTDLKVGELPAAFDQEIFLCSSASVEGSKSGAAIQFRDFLKRHQLPDQLWSQEASAFAIARILEESLRRAGRELSREKFVQRLESLHNFETGVVPPISFGSNQRVGVPALGIFEADPGKNDLRLVGTVSAP